MAETDGTIPLDELRRRAAAWCRAREISLCVRFGSRARGAAHDESDADVAVFVEAALAPGDFLTFRRELVEISDLLSISSS